MDGGFCKNNQRLLASSYFHKMLHVICLTELWIHPCIDFSYFSVLQSDLVNIFKFLRFCFSVHWSVFDFFPRRPVEVFSIHWSVLDGQLKCSFSVFDLFVTTLLNSFVMKSAWFPLITLSFLCAWSPKILVKIYVCLLYGLLFNF